MICEGSHAVGSQRFKTAKLIRGANSETSLSRTEKHIIKVQLGLYLAFFVPLHGQDGRRHAKRDFVHFDTTAVENAHEACISQRQLRELIVKHKLQMINK
jgi:hypothetical protein